MVDSPSHASLAEELQAGGFDVFAPMRVSWYNDYLRKPGLATDSTSYLEKTGETHVSGEKNRCRIMAAKETRWLFSLEIPKVSSRSDQVRAWVLFGSG